MATKYIGAKLLAKEREKEKKKQERLAKRTKGTMYVNDGETLSHANKRRFDITSQTMMMENDFVVAEDDTDPNPEFTNAYDNLRRNPFFLLTYDQQLFQEDPMAESESDDEAEEK